MIRRFGSEAKKPPKLSKLVDLKKDGWTRLKLLKQYGLQYDLETFKHFFKENASILFFTMHDCFCQHDADSSSKQRASHRTSLPDELELIFSSFEKILCYLPELIKKRWHFNSILTILRRLLHPGNKLLVKAIGVKLFVLWYKILQDEASELCHQMFASLLPGLGTISADFDQTAMNFKSSSSNLSQNCGVSADIYAPVLIDSKQDQQSTYGSLDTLVETFLASLSPDCPQIYWVDPEMHSSSCVFILAQFLEYYGTKLFPCLTDNPTSNDVSNVKTQHLKQEDMEDELDGEGWEKATFLPANSGDPCIGAEILARCQSTILTWLLRHITVSNHSIIQSRNLGNGYDTNVKKSGVGHSDDTPFSVDAKDVATSDIGNSDIMPRSQASESGSSGGADSCGETNDKESSGHGAILPDSHVQHSHSVTSSIGSASMPSGDRLLLRALTGNRNMVSSIHTMLRHAYYLPPSHLATIVAVTRTYREWLKKAAALVARRHSRMSRDSPNDLTEEETPQSGSDAFTYEENRLTGGLPFDSLVSVFLSSSAAAFSQMEFQPEKPQTPLQSSHTNGKNAGSSSGSLHQYSKDSTLNMAHYEVAMYILSTCHDLVASHSATMSRDGWELLLNTLLGFIDCRLPAEPDADDSDKRIVRYLIQTLLVTLVRASLFVPIPTDLWDRASSKMAQFATNQDVLSEWVKCVRKLTELFSMQVLEVNWRAAVAAAMASERNSVHISRSRTGVSYRLSRQPSSSMSNHSYYPHPLHHQVSQTSSASGSGRRFIDRRVPAVSATTVKRPHNLQYAPLISPPLVSNPNDRTKEGTLNFDSSKNQQRVPSYIVVSNRVNDYYASGTRTDEDVSFTLPYAAGSAVHQRLRSLSGNSPQGLSVSLMDSPKEQQSLSSEKITRSGHLSPPHTSVDARSGTNISVESEITPGVKKSSTGLSGTKKSQSMGDLTNIVLDDSLKSDKESSAPHSEEEVFQSPSSPVVSPTDVEVEEREDMYASAPNSVLHVASAPDTLSLPVSPELGGHSTTSTDVHASGMLGDDSRPGSGLVLVDRAASSLGFCGPEDCNSNVMSSERDSFSLNDNLSEQKNNNEETLGNGSGVLGDSDQISQNTTTSKQLSNNSMITGNSEVEDEAKVDTISSAERIQGSEATNIFSRPVLAGGNTMGWTPTSAYVIWRRLLGIIGNPNVSLNEDASAHTTVFRFLSDLARGLVACREAQSLNAVIRPDIFIFAPLFFDSLKEFDGLENFLQSNITSIDVLSRILCLQHDPELPPRTDFVIAYYLAIHGFIVSQSKPMISALIHAMNIRFIASSLPGKTLLFADLARACQVVVDTYLEQPTGMTSSFIGSEGGSEFSKLESAISLMGSLLCFARSHGPEMICLDPDSDELVEKPVSCYEISELIISTLLRLADRPIFYSAPRLGQLIVCTLTIFLSHECENVLTDKSDSSENSESEHKDFDPVFRQLSGVVRYVPHAVDRDRALEVCEAVIQSFLHLSNYAKQVLATRCGEELVRNLILDLSSILYWLCHHAESCTREAEIRLGCLMTYCLIEWSLAIPLQFLLQTVKFPSGPHALVYKVFKGLTVAATKGSQYLGTTKSSTLNEVSNGSLRPEAADSGTLLAGTPKNDHPPPPPTLRPSQAPSLLQLAARWALAHLLQHLGLYPYSTPSQSSSNSNTRDTSFGANDAAPDSDSSPVQYIALQGQSIISVYADEESSLQNSNSFGFDSSSWMLSDRNTSFTVRDISGNYAWTSRLVCGHRESCVEMHNWPEECPHYREHQQIPVNNQKLIGSVQECSVSEDVACSLLKIVNEIKAANTTATTNDEVVCQDKPGVICEVEEAVLHCAEVEEKFIGEEWSRGETVAPSRVVPNDAVGDTSPGETYKPDCFLTRLFLECLGWLTAGHGGSDIVHLRTSESFYRDLRHLDHLKNDTHKVAVAFVACGQEDSASVLSNANGSPEYEQFVAGLGWNVPVASHQGFLGGVARDGTYGSQIPYFGSATCEVAFHVATMMPPGNTCEETVRKRTKHLGNDEVQVVWSEHWRRYKRDVIPGDFGDVVIIIKPLPDLGLFQIFIKRKNSSSASSDGQHLVIGPPLYNGVVLDAASLATAVRSAAIGASRSLAFSRPHYRPFFAERHGHIQYVIHKYRQAEGLANFVTELSFGTKTASSSTTGATSTGASTPSLPMAMSGINSIVSSSQSMMQLQQTGGASLAVLPSYASNYLLLQSNES